MLKLWFRFLEIELIKIRCVSSKFLLPIDAVESDMQNDTYNANTMEPGITVYGSWENDEKVYHRWGNDDDFEPLIIKRNFNGVATDSVEVAEEFRLLFNLYFNSQK